MQQKTVVVGDMLVTYQHAAGNGGTMLLLHGWGDSAATFGPFVAGLSGKYDIVALNLPGFGGSQNPASPWNVSDYAEFVRQFLTKLKIKKLHGVVGHSNGGAIAVRLLASHPALTDKLVLIASAGIRSTADQRLHRQAFKMLAKSGRLITKPLGTRIQSRLKTQLYKKAGSDYLLLPHMQETFKKVVAEDVREAAKRLSQDVLLVWGSDDVSTPVFMAHAYAGLIRHSHLEIIQGADHFVHQNHTGEVARLTEEFLA